jgi:N-acetylmuramoyl-L-alanine amidase
MTTVKKFAISSSNNGCSTAGLRGLNDQIVELLLRAVNNETKTHLVTCTDIPNLRVVGNSTIPLLQPAAKKSLKRVIELVGRELKLVHAYRTVAQQFVLRQWRINGRCNITQARNPGTSDHEKAIAIDIDDFDVWKNALVDNGWKWAGMGDRGHFSFIGSGIRNELLTDSVRAFQRLWNQNNPDDLIDEDGVFGDIETGPRLLRSPVEGFGSET